MTSVTIWGGTDKTAKSFTNNQFDVYYSADGETWTLHSEYSNVCGNGTSAGAGSVGFTEERTAGENTYYGLKLEMNNATVKYIRIAIKKGRLDNGWATLRDMDVVGTEIAIPVSVAGIQQNANGDVRLVGATDSLKAEGVGFKLDITHTYEELTQGSATTIAKIEATQAARSGYEIEDGADNDLSTSYIATKENSARYGVTDGVFGSGSTYRDYITVELSALSTMTSVTIWGGTDKNVKNFTNNQFDVYYSADGETWTLHSEYSNVCGDGTSAGAGSVGFTEERTAGENTYYGLKLEMNNATAKYVRIAIKKGRVDNGWATLRDIDVVGYEQSGETKTITKTATYTTEPTDTVYNSILAAGENVTAKDINASYSDAHKLYALGITGIPQSGTVELEVTPYFIPVGTDIKFYGDAATFEFIDGKPLKWNETVNVMSYNLCNGQVNNKTLTQRLDYIAAQINSVDPDIVVLNEAHNFDAEHPTYDIAISSLTAKCDVNYGIVEYPDKESKNVVLYNTAKYTLVSSEVIDLPNESQDGTESGAYARTAVFARLKRISDNREFVVSAIHFDYVKSVAKMQAWAVNGHLAENYADVRQIVAGDFNIVGTSSTVHINPFVNEGYVNANTESDATATYPEGAEGENVIDFIYSKDFKASDYTVVNAENASAASDHRAIYAELTLN